MAKHTREELELYQSLPLEVKIRMTEQRIKGWVSTFGQDGVYISFSGGKDSTVLLDIIRNRMHYDNIPAVFVDVPTQYPELKEFAQKESNLEILKSRISFMQVCERYGFPLISKEISQAVYEARVQGKTNQVDPRKTNLYKRRFDEQSEHNSKYGQFCFSKYDFLFDAEFNISHKCCSEMKKKPAKLYEKKTGRVPIIATMAEESRVRQSAWIKNGCNAFDNKRPTSQPLSFWTEQDILEYIVKYDIEICSVYGDVVEDYREQLDGQMHLADYGLAEKKRYYKCTGCKRTGCMLCGFGCQSEKSPNRFEILKETHPKMYALLDVIKSNGVTFREAIEWINEHGNMDIKL